MNASTATEEKFDSKTHVKELKRKCNECGKVWHSLDSREKQLSGNIKMNGFMTCAFCGNPGAQLQAVRNSEAGQSELQRLKKCPDCGSGNYHETAVVYEKK